MPVIESLPLETQTLYSELVDQLRVADFVRSFASLSGGFTKRKKGGGHYWYFRTSEGPGRSPQEFYVGPDNEATWALMDGYQAGREAAKEAEARIVRLSAMLRSGGIALTDAPSARIIKGLGAAGVFRLGGVLIGTHAFLALGNALGVKWPSSLHTRDEDFGAPRRIGLGIPQTPQLVADLPAAIESLEMGFIPYVRVHADTRPTSFVVHGQDWRIDLLTSPRGADRDVPVKIPRLGSFAQPLEFMDYLLEKTLDAAVVNGGASLARIPEPARFALHKLLVASQRDLRSAAKADKDRMQAFLMLGFLQRQRAGDILLAAEDLCGRGPGWSKRLRQQAALLPEPLPELQDVLDRIKV